MALHRYSGHHNCRIYLLIGVHGQRTLEPGCPQFYLMMHQSTAWCRLFSVTKYLYCHVTTFVKEYFHRQVFHKSNKQLGITMKKLINIFCNGIIRQNLGCVTITRVQKFR